MLFPVSDNKRIIGEMHSHIVDVVEISGGAKLGCCCCCCWRENREKLRRGGDSDRDREKLSLSLSRRVMGGIFNAELLRNFVRAINNIRATKAGKTRFKIVDFSGGEAAPVVPRRGFAEYAFSPPRNLVRLLYP